MADVAEVASADASVPKAARRFYVTDGAVPNGTHPRAAQPTYHFISTAGRRDHLDGSLPRPQSGARGVLFPAAIYDSIGHVTGTSGNPLPGAGRRASHADLRVVAMRIDPCFAALARRHMATGCRAAATRFSRSERHNGEVAVFDSAMHAFTHSIATSFCVSPMRSSLAQSESSARLGALAVHPVMVSQGSRGRHGDGRAGLILEYAGC